jgi:hypothetical protein
MHHIGSTLVSESTEEKGYVMGIAKNIKDIIIPPKKPKKPKKG